MSRLSCCLLAAVTVMGCAPAGDILEDRGGGGEAVTASAAVGVSPDYGGFFVKVHGQRTPAASTVYPCDSSFDECLALDSSGNTPYVTGLCPSDDHPAGDWAFDFGFYADANCDNEVATISCQPIPGHHLSKGQQTNWVECWTTNGSKNFDVCVVDPDTGAGRENCPVESKRILVLASTLDPMLDPTDAADLALLRATPIVRAIEELGFLPDIVNNATWTGMTQAKFAGYRALVLGDPPAEWNASVYEAAKQSKETWLKTIAGNVVVVGSDPSHHSPGGTDPLAPGAYQLIRDSIKFSTWRPYQTGLFVALGHTFAGGGDLTFMNSTSGALGALAARQLLFTDDYNTVEILVPDLQAFADVTNDNLSHWNTTIHELVPPPAPYKFQPFAIAQNASGATDGDKAFIIIRDVSTH